MDGFKHFFHVPFDPDFAPFPAQHPFCIDQKCAALDAQELASIQGFLPDYIELPAQDFLGIRQQVERKLLPGLELFMRFDAVA